MVVAETIVNQKDNLVSYCIKGWVTLDASNYIIGKVGRFNFYCQNMQDRFLAFPAEQHPIVLQIGGSNLDNLAKATELANAYPYDEINLK